MSVREAGLEKDPLAGSAWSSPGTVAGFSDSPPNAVLLRFAEEERRGLRHPRALDLGCGAARNAAPLARLGWEVFGIDLSWPMIAAARRRALDERLTPRLHVALAPMDRLPARDASVDLVIAHGIWNLAQSAAEFRRAVREAARAARPGAGLFVFTFSRNTLPPDDEPVAGESFVFTGFSGRPQCFLTDEQLRDELNAAGFLADPSVPLTEHNRPGRRGAQTSGPVIYEGSFRRSG